MEETKKNFSVIKAKLTTEIVRLISEELPDDCGRDRLDVLFAAIYASTCSKDRALWRALGDLTPVDTHTGCL